MADDQVQDQDASPPAPKADSKPDTSTTRKITPREPPVREPETFSKEYVHELREESKGYRLKLQESEQQKKDAEAAALQKDREAEDRVKEINTKAEERIIRAELKSAALKAGMIDTDGLKLADLSKVKLNSETGEVEGAEALMEDLKKSKPYLFGVASTSSTQKAPDPAPNKPKLATEMSKEEYEAARKKVIGGTRKR